MLRRGRGVRGDIPALRRCARAIRKVVNIAHTSVGLFWYVAVQEGLMLAENETWKHLYERAILEADSQKIAERISEARQAIAGRLRDLEHDSNHHTERQRMDDALRLLTILEAEG
jgi:hypothetical protein